MPSDYDKKLAAEFHGCGGKHAVFCTDPQCGDSTWDHHCGDGYEDGCEECDKLAALIERARKDLAAENKRLESVGVRIQELRIEAVNDRRRALEDLDAATEELEHRIAENQRLFEEQDLWKQTIEEHKSRARSRKRRLTAAESRIENMKEALRIYGYHLEGCHETQDDCTCGFRAALAPLSTPAEEEPEA